MIPAIRRNTLHGIWTEAHEKAGAGRFLVGVDANIAPAECTAYAEIYGEFDGSLGAMWASTPTRSLRILTKIDKTLL